MSSRDLLTGFGLKLVFAGLFYFISAHHYGNGQLSADAANFYRDAGIVADFGRENPMDYFGLLFGFGAEDQELLEHGLSETLVWDYGDNGDIINDNRLIIRLHSLIHFISFDNVFVHLAFMAFISFLGLLFIFRALETYIANKRLFFYSILLFPSIAFWGSGLSKEAIMIVGLGLYLFAFLNLLKERGLLNSLLLIVAILILLFNKPYVGLIIIPISFILWIGNRMDWKKKYLYLCTVFIVAVGLLLSFTPKKYNLVDKISGKQQDLINLSKGGIFFINDSSFCSFKYKSLDHFSIEDTTAIVLASTDGEYKLFGQDEFKPFTIERSEKRFDLYLVQAPSNSYVEATPVAGSGLQLLKNTPSALYNTLIRPLPGDVKNPLSNFVMIQNFGFLAFIIFVLFRRRKLDDEGRYLVYFLLTSGLLMLLLIGWTTPILGAIFRYKVAAEIVILISLFIILKPLKINK